MSDNMKCDWPECKSNVSWAMYKVTQNRYKRTLCIEHQIAHVEMAYEKMPKLRDHILDEIKGRFRI